MMFHTKKAQKLPKASPRPPLANPRKRSLNEAAHKASPGNAKR